MRFTVTYYFHNTDGRASLPAVMPLLLGLAKRATSEQRPPQVRQRGEMLHGAIDDLAVTLVPSFVGPPDPSKTSTEEAREAYAKDNLHPPAERPV